MHIDCVWLSQRNLKRAGQIPAMVEAIQNGEILPKITLSRTEDGAIQLLDGHHRLAAYWLAGRTTLAKQEYLLVEQDQWRPRCGKLIDLLRNYRSISAPCCPEDRASSPS